VELMTAGFWSPGKPPFGVLGASRQMATTSFHAPPHSRSFPQVGWGRGDYPYSLARPGFHPAGILGWMVSQLQGPRAKVTSKAVVASGSMRCNPEVSSLASGLGLYLAIDLESLGLPRRSAVEMVGTVPRTLVSQPSYFRLRFGRRRSRQSPLVRSPEMWKRAALRLH
jgi:hypothetical protein